MHSSPGTPMGQGLFCASRIRTVVLAIGLPTVIPLEVSVIRAQVDHTVVSVGPYRFHSSQPRAISWSARSLGRASPPTNALNGVLPFQPASKSRRQVTGVACITVA